MPDEVEYGVVVEVVEVRAGSELVEPATAGDTQLWLGDADDFNEDGGQATIGTEVVTYVSADLDDGQVLTLAAPLVGSYDAEERVWVHPATVERRAWVQLDDDEEGGDALEARVPHTLYDHVDLGTRATTGTQERVGVQLDGDEWVVADVRGREPVIDGSYIDPDTMPNVPSGPDEPPTASPTLTATGTRDAITLVAEGLVDQYTTLTYYMNGEAFTTTRSTVVVVRETLAGEPLVLGTVYRFKVQAENVLGAAPESPEIEAALNPEVDTQTVLAAVATGFVLAGEIKVGNISIHSDTGITIPLASGGEIRFPSDGSAAVIDAILRTDDLAVNGGLSINGITNYVRGVLHLAVGVDDPTTTPRLYWDWWRRWWQPSGIVGGFNEGCQGLARSADGSTWATVARSYEARGNRRTLVNNTTGESTILGYDPNSTITWINVTAVGGQFYWLGRVAATGFAVVETYDQDGTYRNRVSVTDDNGDRIPLANNDGALAGDPTDGGVLWLAHSKNLRVHRYRWPIGETGTLSASQADRHEHLDKLYASFVTAHWVGEADFGVHRLVFLGGVIYSTEGDLSQHLPWPYVVTDQDGNVQDDECWGEETAAPNTQAIWWDTESSRFLTASEDAQGWFVAEFGTHTTDAMVYGQYTWYDDDTAGGYHESGPSPMHQIPAPRRCTFLWNVPVPPLAGMGQDDPSAVRLYLGTTAEDLKLLDTITTGTAVTYTTAQLAGTGQAPPTVSTFPPEASTGEVRDSQGGYWRGTGAFQLGPLSGPGDGSIALASTTDRAAGFSPIGTIIMFGGEDPPWSWLVCDGSSVSRTTYAELYAVLGGRYGTLSTNYFTLPDLRRRFPWGAAPGLASGALDLAANDGKEIAERTLAHTHAIPQQGSELNAATWSTPNTGTNPVPRSTAFQGHNHGGSTGGVANWPPNLALTFLIRAR